MTFPKRPNTLNPLVADAAVVAADVVFAREDGALPVAAAVVGSSLAPVTAFVSESEGGLLFASNTVLDILCCCCWSAAVDAAMNNGASAMSRTTTTTEVLDTSARIDVFSAAGAGMEVGSVVTSEEALLAAERVLT